MMTTPKKSLSRARQGVLIAQDPKYLGPSRDNQPKFILTCPACGKRKMRIAYSWRYNANEQFLNFLSFRCGDGICPANLMVRRAIDAPDWDAVRQRLPATDDTAGATAIPRKKLPPGDYQAERTELIIDERGHLIGMKYLVLGQWITHIYPEENDG